MVTGITMGASFSAEDPTRKNGVGLSVRQFTNCCGVCLKLRVNGLALLT